MLLTLIEAVGGTFAIDPATSTYNRMERCKKGNCMRHDGGFKTFDGSVSVADGSCKQSNVINIDNVVDQFASDAEKLDRTS